MLMLRGASGNASRRSLITKQEAWASTISSPSSTSPLTSFSASCSRLASTSSLRPRTWALKKEGAGSQHTAGAAAVAAGGGRGGLLSSSVQAGSPQHQYWRGFAAGGGGGGNNNCSTQKNVLGEPLELTPMPFNASMLDTDTMRVTDTSDFTTRMLVTVQQLRKEGKSSLWARVHALNGHLLGVLGTFGFKCHHCEPDTIVMNLWLQPGKENKVPPYATHLVGVAGFCMNKKNEVLLVKEGSKAVSGWKLPGGYVNPGEEFGAAAVREVEEETGVQSTFEGLLAVRHQHNLSFGVDDIYVVTRLAAVTDELRLCSSEIEDARWVPFAQFQREASHPILKTVAELMKGSVGVERTIDIGVIVESEHLSILPNRPPYKLYHAPIREAK